MWTLNRLNRTRFSLCVASVLGAFASVACGGAGRDEASMPAVCNALPLVSTEPDDAVPPDIASPRTALVGGTVMTAVGDIYAPGYVIMENGRLIEVGEGEPASLGDDTVVFDVTGRWVTPGIIDTHSHLGVYPSPGYEALADGNEASSPLTPHVQAVHSIWPQDPGFERALQGGVTSMLVLPGSANVVGGRGFTLKLHYGALAAQDMAFPGAPPTLKMACGENPKRVYGGDGGFPQTRMGEIAALRQALYDASDYLRSHREYEEQLVTWCDSGAEGEAPIQPAVSLENDTLARLLDGTILVQIHCYRADEMLIQMQIAEEFGYSIRAFHHAIEAYKIREALAESDISISTWADWWGFKLEAFDGIMESAALFEESGGRPVIHSDSPYGIQRLNQEAAKAWQAGLEAGVDLDANTVLQWITLNAAWTLGVEDQTGSLEVGKMADVTVWSGDPFSVYTHADLVFVDGLLEYDRSAPRDPWSDFEVGQWPDLEAR